MSNVSKTDGCANAIMIAVFCEGSFDTIEKAPTKEWALGFCAGFAGGASTYGSGAFGVYILPEDEAEMRENEDDGEAVKALAEAAKMGSKAHSADG